MKIPNASPAAKALQVTRMVNIRMPVGTRAWSSSFI